MHILHVLYTNIKHAHPSPLLPFLGGFSLHLEIDKNMFNLNSFHIQLPALI